MPDFNLAEFSITDRTASVGIWLAIFLLVVLVVGSILMYWKQRHDAELKKKNHPQSWTLPELREMLKNGQLTPTEFELLKNQMLVRYRASGVPDETPPISPPLAPPNPSSASAPETTPSTMASEPATENPRQDAQEPAGDANIQGRTGPEGQSEQPETKEGH